MDNQMLEFCGKVKQISEKACLINVDGVTAWVPDSVADYIDEPEKGKEIKFLISKFMAKVKGFI